MGGYDVRDRDHAAGSDGGGVVRGGGAEPGCEVCQPDAGPGAGAGGGGPDSGGRDLRGEEGQETVRGTVSPTNGHRTNAKGLAGLSSNAATITAARRFGRSPTNAVVENGDTATGQEFPNTSRPYRSLARALIASSETHIPGQNSQSGAAGKSNR